MCALKIFIVPNSGHYEKKTKKHENKESQVKSNINKKLNCYFWDHVN